MNALQPRTGITQVLVQVVESVWNGFLMGIGICCAYLVFKYFGWL